MKKEFALIISIIWMGVLCACGNMAENTVMLENPAATEKETIAADEKLIGLEEDADGTESVTEEAESQAEEVEVVPMVMVKGELYYATGRECELTGRCGTMDGNITSTVSGEEIPTEDNQSNFGIGYGYQYGTENTLEIPIDNVWYVFEKRDETVSVTEESTGENVSTTVVLENPSWEYYIAKETVTEAAPYQLAIIEENTNDITDTEEWFAEIGLIGWEPFVEESDGEYLGLVSSESYVNIYKGGQFIKSLDFSNYLYSDDYIEEDIAFVEETVGSAVINDDILYVSTFHYTYAASAPSNAYITAISLEDYSVIWKSQPLVCNSYNFTIIEDVLFCGYGFTDEEDYLYQLDKKTGVVLDKTKLKSKPDYIVYKDGNLYVRTYNTDYVFGIE